MTEEVVGFTKKQREWFKERDKQCQMFFYRNGRWEQCPNKSNLQVHHIIPRYWASKHLPSTFPINGSQQGICLCTSCHVGINGVHPDTYKAREEYRKGDKLAYVKMKDHRKTLTFKGIPYWNTQWDWLFQRRIKKLNLKMLKTRPYPTNSRRGNNGRL